LETVKSIKPVKENRMGFKEFWLNKSHVSQAIFILIIVYGVSAIHVLLLALGALPYLPQVHRNPYILVIFALVSFALTVFISAYHLSTMIQRRKRSGDMEPQEDDDE
jgi:heme/copper-type cytochrome/quinol oxidase subunit 2